MGYYHSGFIQPVDFFVERNWGVHTTLSQRSRDNLPNSEQDDDHAYVPRNMPARADGDRENND